MVKKFIYYLSILALILTLTACSKAPEEKEGPSLKGKINLKDKLNKNQEEEKEEKETIIRKDKEGLIEVHIEDGKATVYFDLELWEDLLAISNYESPISPFGGPFSIQSLSGRVKDAAICQISSLDLLKEFEGPVPTIFLLMEDGSVEWLTGQPFPLDPQDKSLISIGRLPWIEDISSLEVANDGEGIGEDTVYGIDSKGDSYLLRVAGEFSYLPIGQWIWTIASLDSTIEDIGVLSLTEDGGAIYQIGTMDGARHSRYTGSYGINIRRQDDKVPAMISLDLELDYSSNPNQVVHKIEGQFFSQVTNLTYLELWPSHGDSLYVYGGDFQPSSYEFWLANNPLEGNWERLY